MRILSGKYAWKRLDLPSEAVTRPTSGKVREAIFNILNNITNIQGLKVLDAFAGSGALGLEALSRGASKAYFMEINSNAFTVLKENIYRLGVESDSKIIRGDAVKPRQSPETCDLIFLDPPYAQGLVEKSLKALSEVGWVGEGSLIVIEYASREELQLPNDLEILVQKKYGDTSVLVGKKIPSKFEGK